MLPFRKRSSRAPKHQTLNLLKKISFLRILQEEKDFTFELYGLFKNNSGDM